MAAALVVGAAACSPIYVLKAGWAEFKILKARRPIPEVVADSSVDARTRSKLALVLEARTFARDSLSLDVGDAYTSFTRLESDTLAMVLSAAYRDRLQSKTWWFPVVGHVPYKGFFDYEDAEDERLELESEGFDTYLRPTAAFSTLGWFADPLLSTLLRQDEVELVETVLHELSHNHLFVSGRVTFNESYATFVGRTGAIAFFCRRQGGGPDTVWCQRAEARWRDTQRYSVFIDRLVSELREIYGDTTLAYDDKIERREVVFRQSLERFRTEVQPGFESLSFGGILSRPLNNATLLGGMRYYHRLPDFAALLERHGGDLAAAVAYLAERAGEVDDPFELLGEAGAGRTSPARDESLLITDDSFYGIRIGQRIDSIPDERVRTGMLRTGEGEFEVHEILGPGGRKLGYFLPHPLREGRVGDIVVESPDAATPEGVSVGMTYREVSSLLDSFEVHGSEVESRTHVFHGAHALRLDYPNNRHDLQRSEIPGDARVLTIEIRRGRP